MTNSNDWFASIVEDFVKYLSIEKNRSLNTVRTYKTDLELFLQFATNQGIKQLSDLDLNTFRLWLADQKIKDHLIPLFLEEVALHEFSVPGLFKRTY